MESDNVEVAFQDIAVKPNETRKLDAIGSERL